MYSYFHLLKHTCGSFAHNIVGDLQAHSENTNAKAFFTAEERNLARIRAFDTSGFNTKLYGNLCQYYKSFVGQDFKGWAQISIFILGPYLNQGAGL